MSYGLLGVSLGMAVVDWVSVNRKLKWLEFLAKPATMVLLLVWMGLVTRFQGGSLWFGLGLSFSLAGDVFLMLRHERFLAGLVAFLLGHLCYLIGFNQVPPPINMPALLLVIPVAVTAAQVYPRVAAGLARHNLAVLKLPVLAYVMVISLMLYSALLTLVRSEWQTAPALFVSAGALLFYLSDATLAWNKFVTLLPWGRERVIVSYHLGQILLALGAAQHFLAG